MNKNAFDGISVIYQYNNPNIPLVSTKLHVDTMRPFGLNMMITNILLDDLKAEGLLDVDKEDFVRPYDINSKEYYGLTGKLPMHSINKSKLATLKMSTLLTDIASIKNEESSSNDYVVDHNMPIQPYINWSEIVSEGDFYVEVKKKLNLVSKVSLPALTQRINIFCKDNKIKNMCISDVLKVLNFDGYITYRDKPVSPSLLTKNDMEILDQKDRRRLIAVRIPVTTFSAWNGSVAQLLASSHYKEDGGKISLYNFTYKFAIITEV